MFQLNRRLQQRTDDINHTEMKIDNFTIDTFDLLFFYSQPPWISKRTDGNKSTNQIHDDSTYMITRLFLMAHNCPCPQLNCCFLCVVPCCHWFCFLFGEQQFRCRRDLGLLRAASVSCLQTHNSSVWTIFTYLFFLLV